MEPGKSRHRGSMGKHISLISKPNAVGERAAKHAHFGQGKIGAQEVEGVLGGYATRGGHSLRRAGGHLKRG